MYIYYVRSVCIYIRARGGKYRIEREGRSTVLNTTLFDYIDMWEQFEGDLIFLPRYFCLLSII
jgi:hypothetical protein